MGNIHPEWYDFVLRLFHRLSADARGWHAHAAEGRVWSCVCCSRHHVTEICAHWEHQCRNVLELGNLMTQRSLMRCNLRLFCFAQSLITHGKNYKLCMRLHSFNNYLSINIPRKSPDDTCMCWCDVVTSSGDRKDCNCLHTNVCKHFLAGI